MPIVARPNTTIHGGSFHTVRSKNPAREIAKSRGVKVALVQTGSQKAAARPPTTEAFAPRIAARAKGRERKLSQNGGVP